MSALHILIVVAFWSVAAVLFARVLTKGGEA